MSIYILATKDKTLLHEPRGMLSGYLLAQCSLLGFFVVHWCKLRGGFFSRIYYSSDLGYMFVYRTCNTLFMGS
eukprot:UN32708